MAAPLSERTQLALHKALASFEQRGRRLTLVAPMRGGLTNRSFLLMEDGERFVLRLNNPHSDALGIDRSLEREVLQALPPATAPAVQEWHADFMLSAFVDTVTAPAVSPIQSDLIATLRKVHAVQLALPPIHYLTRFAELLPRHHYADWNDLASALDCWQRRVTAEFGHHPGLCHHDLLPDNILWTVDHPYIIDWEYAAMGDVFFDLASLVESHRLDATEQVALLQAYGLHVGFTPKLQVFRALYSALVAAWNLRSGLASDGTFDYINGLMDSA